MISPIKHNLQRSNLITFKALQEDNIAAPKPPSFEEDNFPVPIGATTEEDFVQPKPIVLNAPQFNAEKEVALHPQRHRVSDLNNKKIVISPQFKLFNRDHQLIEASTGDVIGLLIGYDYSPNGRVNLCKSMIIEQEACTRNNQYKILQALQLKIQTAYPQLIEMLKRNDKERIPSSPQNSPKEIVERTRKNQIAQIDRYRRVYLHGATHMEVPRISYREIPDIISKATRPSILARIYNGLDYIEATLGLDKIKHMKK